jgi:hypothetical protein
MYDPDRTYLDVDFTGTPGYASGFNQFAKDCGARFDWENRLFYIPTNICPMAALCVFPAISYARHLSVQIVKCQQNQGMAPRHCARPMIIVGSSVPSACACAPDPVLTSARGRWPWCSRSRCSQSPNNVLCHHWHDDVHDVHGTRRVHSHNDCTAQIHKNIRRVIDALRNTPRFSRHIRPNGVYF